MDRRQWFAIAAIGRDRPGIVADLSEFVYACGCNLEDASMTMLGNEFATLMLVSGVGAELANDLANGARKLEWERRLTVFIRPVDACSAVPALNEPAPWVLVAEGVDKAGIVAGLSRCLAERGILITDLRGRVSPMAESGTPLYTLTLRMNVPPAVDLKELDMALREVAAKLDIELSLAQEH
jgi:glycine cleavage system transcriptional repressor